MPAKWSVVMALPNRNWSIQSVAGVLLVAATVLMGCGGSGTAPDNIAKTPASLPAAVAKAKADNTEVSPAIVGADNAFALSVLRALQS